MKQPLIKIPMGGGGTMFYIKMTCSRRKASRGEILGVGVTNDPCPIPRPPVSTTL